MIATPRTSEAPQPGPEPFPAMDSPFLRAPEGARTVFVVTLLAAAAPLLAGFVLFGRRAMMVAAIAIGGCVIIEWLYFRVTRFPALLGRTHGYLTGVLLALTLPPFVPWYVPLVAAAFAIIVGKAAFGGVGHFLWQPALVGRLAVAFLFAGPIEIPARQVNLLVAKLDVPAIKLDLPTMDPRQWPVLAQNRLLIGDVAAAKTVERTGRWRNRPADPGYDGFKYPPPATVLRGLTDTDDPKFSALAYVPTNQPRARPAALMKLPPIGDLISGTYCGGIGETSAVILIVAGLYLIYRNYVKWPLPVSILVAAAATFAVSPVSLSGPNDTVVRVWVPLTAEGLDVGFLYVSYHLLGGQLPLAAFFLATEMTSRPVTTGGQVLFGIAVGVLAAVLTLYVRTPIPCYVAILIMNTLTPLIDSIWRPRVLGTRRFAWLFRRRA